MKSVDPKRVVCPDEDDSFELDRLLPARVLYNPREGINKNLRLAVATPADSKWLPRIGDWICTGCTNNNYASREK
ncbi:hypothetical protein L6164_027639 [Bauhinia variegata]|uniref:Uncharacterized protein n=1 Tax=Bauhinia variegata TaxID=167791 RepID=A0ACB9LUJ1_BAUVA|nr:hypothetical protein L6164_027639 [Bauhinia variegata]